MEKTFVHCEKCGKRLIARMPDGSGEFLFGRQEGYGKSPVEIKLWGMIEISCLNRTCNHKQKMAFFPTQSGGQAPEPIATAKLSGS